MGSSFSSGNGVYVHLDKPYYSPGDVVNGIVLMNVVTPVHANELILKVEGYEKTEWTEKITHNDWDAEKQEMRERVEYNKHDGEKDFFRIKIPLQSYPQHVQPGQYQFPFSFALPVGLPGSFKYSTGQHGNLQDIKAKVAYKVKVECDVPGPNLKAKARMVVHQRPAKLASEMLIRDTQRVVVCCCCDKGSATITARVQKDTYVPGEQINVILEVENQSTSEFSATVLSLHRNIHVRKKGHAHFNMKDSITHASAPGVSAGQVAVGQAARSLSVIAPTALLSTTVGQLVTCEYELEVLLKASAFVSDLRVRLPVTVYQALPSVPVPTEYPPGWNPQVVMPALQVALPSAPPVPPPMQIMGDGVVVATPAGLPGVPMDKFQQQV